MLATSTTDSSTEQNVNLSAKTSFGRHETFHIRDGWLVKGMGAVGKAADIFGKTDAIDVLGVGRNMVAAIRYWLSATGLIEEIPKSGHRGPTHYKLTPLANLILEQDPYIEDDATLWVLHLKLATNWEAATSWYWAFNCSSQSEFSKETFQRQLRRFLADRDSEVSTSSVERDFNCFVRTYVPTQKMDAHAPSEDTLDCPMATLGLMRRVGDSAHFRFLFEHKANLPNQLVVPVKQTVTYQDFAGRAGL